MPRPTLVHLHINGNNPFRNNLNNNDVRYPLIHMRDHLFHTAFVRLALIYARVFSIWERKVIEFLLLTLSFLSFVLLMYIHMAFVQTPSDCLEHVQENWPRNGILRVEILQEKLNGKYSLEKSYLKEKKIRELEYEDLASYFFFHNGMYDETVDYESIMQSPGTIENDNATNSEVTFISNATSFNVTLDEKMNSVDGEKNPLPTITWSEDEYIMEFSLEYGFLKLSPSVRKQFNITVELVTLDPTVDKCFGGPVNNFILYNFLGYDEVLLASLKLLASKEEYKGYVRNVVSEVEFIFVNAWMDRKSYITAGFVMMVFTVSISILLRYSHHQIFVFIVELLHMVEFHSSFNFPAGPLLTVILALVGMEAIMSEFFNDTAIAFYVILIVWMADQFDTICCKSFFTKKHWLRFFYLYHFFFYAYSYRFGHNRFLALLTSWLFTIHSMVYFFHRYELPILINQLHRRQNNPPGNGPNNDAPELSGTLQQETQENTPNNSPEDQPERTERGSSDIPNDNDTVANDTNPTQQADHADLNPTINPENNRYISIIDLKNSKYTSINPENYKYISVILPKDKYILSVNTETRRHISTIDPENAKCILSINNESRNYVSTIDTECRRYSSAVDPDIKECNSKIDPGDKNYHLVINPEHEECYSTSDPELKEYSSTINLQMRNYKNFISSSLKLFCEQFEYMQHLELSKLKCLKIKSKSRIETKLMNKIKYISKLQYIFIANIVYFTLCVTLIFPVKNTTVNSSNIFLEEFCTATAI